MRWGLGSLTVGRRRPTGDLGAPVPAAAPSASSAPPVADWRRVEPLALTIAPRPTLVGGTLLRQPEVSGTRSLIKRGSSGAGRAQPPDDPTIAPGRVGGIVAAKTPTADRDAASRPAELRAGRDEGARSRSPGRRRGGTALSAAQGELRLAADPSALPPARRRAAVQVAAPGDRPNLVEATEEYLGDPRSDDVPYASSAWLRMVQAYRQLPAEAAGTDAFLPGLTQTAKPEGGAVTSWSSEVPFPPPRATPTPSVAAPPAGGSDPAQRLRRATLAESRRLGLGRPLPREPEPPVPPAPVPPAPVPQTPGPQSHVPQAPEPPTPEPPTPVPTLTGQSPPEPPGPVTEPAAELRHMRPDGTGPDGTGPDDSPQPGHGGYGDHDRGGTGPPPTPPAPLAVTVDPAATRRRVPPGLGLGPPITLRGVAPGGASEQAARATRASRDPDPRRTPAVGRDQAHAAASPAPAAPPGTSPASPPGPPRSPLPPLIGRAAPGAPGGPVHASESTASARQGQDSHPAPPPQSAHDAGEPAAKPSAVVTPVYRAVPPAPPRAAAVARPPSGTASPEPLVHREPAQPADQQAPAPTAATPAPSPPPVEPPAPPPPAPPPQFFPPPPAPGPSSAIPAIPGIEFLAPPPTSPDAGLASHQNLSSAPYDLADSIHRMHGVDVSDVVVNRGPDAGSRAGAVGARAFATEREIVLPAEAGPIERPQTRALLAHELTHIAQQRQFGPSLPPEDSAAGAALEGAAVAVERRLLGHEHSEYGHSGAVPQQPLFHAPPRMAASSPLELASAPVQRQTEHQPTAEVAGNAFDPFGLLPQYASQAGPDVAYDYVPIQGPAGPDIAPLDAAFDPMRARMIEIAEQRLLDLDDSIAVGELADSIYSRIRARLRHELLVDRERSGLLSDFR